MNRSSILHMCLLATMVAVCPAVSAAQGEHRVAVNAAEIEAFAFDSRMRMGAGGFVYPVPVPIVLFRNGEALTNVAGLAHAEGLAAHKLAHPDNWTQWRRTAGRLQVRKSQGEWGDLAYNVAYSSLPADFRLNGSYKMQAGSGTLAAGGADSVAVWRGYAFTPDGRVVRDGGAGAYAEIAQGSTASASVAASQRGRYRIDGITLHIEYDDGSREARVIVTDPNDAKSAIWLDGVGYTRGKS